MKLGQVSGCLARSKESGGLLIRDTLKLGVEVNIRIKVKDNAQNSSCGSEGDVLRSGSSSVLLYQPLNTDDSRIYVH